MDTTPFWIIAYCLSRNGGHEDHYVRRDGSKHEAERELDEIINRDWGVDCVLMTASLAIEVAGTDY